MSTTPFYLNTNLIFALASVTNLLNFIDRGIIPGSTNEFNTFIQDDLSTDTPSVYLGLLQSSFIIGLMVGSFIYGHLVHHHERFFLVATGCVFFVVATALSGFAYYTKSYMFLLFARMISGFGEASLQCTVPPWVQEVAPKAQRGMWLAVFYTAIPVGTAAGYIFSSTVTAAAGWQFAFFIESMIMLPLLFYFFFISKFFPGPNEANNNNDDHDHKAPSIKQEIIEVCKRTIFIALTLAYAAQTAVLIGLGTFGSAIVMGLGFFDDETSASSIFGGLISLAGLIATPLGGLAVDWLTHNRDNDEDNSSHPLLEDNNNEDIYNRSSYDLQDDGSQRRSAPKRNRSSEAIMVDSHGHGGGASAVNLSPKERRFQQGRITWFLFLLNVFATIILCLASAITNKVLFLLAIMVGTGLTFTGNAGTNLSLLLAVPAQHRSFAIAVNVIFLHALGDVPSPIIVGYLKDSLAPGCASIEDDQNNDVDDANIAASDACRDDARGLRTVLLLTSLWLCWSAFFFFLAYFLNSRQMETLPHCARDNQEDVDNDLDRSLFYDDDADKRRSNIVTMDAVTAENFRGDESSETPQREVQRSSSRQNSTNNPIYSFASGGESKLQRDEDDVINI